MLISNGLVAESCHDRVSTVNGKVVNEHTCEAVTGGAAKWFSLISLRDVPLRLSDMIFDHESDAPAAVAGRELDEWIPIGLYVLLTAGPVGLMWWQYRRTKL